jgi:hypothetical protein
MARREMEPDAKLERVVIETGGAVILCSLTTTLGYLALLLSINRPCAASVWSPQSAK